MTLSQVDARTSIALSDGMEAVLLPVQTDQIARTYKDGSHLVVVLVDGRELILEGWFAKLEEGTEVALLVRDGSAGEIVAVTVAETGEYAGAMPVSLGRLEEMFGVDADSAEDALQQAGVSAIEVFGTEVPKALVWGGAAAGAVVAYSVLTDDDDDAGPSGPIVGDVDADGRPFVAGPGLTPAGRSYDTDRDGTIDHIDFDQEQDGTVERIWHSDGDDGTFDRITIDAEQDGTYERTEYDADGDGTRERITLDTDQDGSVEQTEYDTEDNGTIDRTEHDANSDGTPERTVHNANAANVDVRTEYDIDNDGSTDRTEHDADGDGTAERTVYSADANGVVRAEYDIDDDGNTDRTEHDANGDGTAERTVYSADANGVVRTDYDNDNDGFANGLADRSEYDNNSDGTPERTEYDSDNDGTPELTVYDSGADGMGAADGSPDRIAHDPDGDGIVNKNEVFAYGTNSESDTVVTKSIDSGGTINIDPDGDGTPNIDTNGDGTIDADTNNDGTLDSGVDADSDGTVDPLDFSGTVQFDSNTNGTFDAVIPNGVLDADGDGTYDTVIFSGTADGTYDEIEAHTYNSAGLVSRITYDNALGTVDLDGDGAADRDENGARIMRRSRDGTVDRTEVFEYDQNTDLMTSKKIDIRGTNDASGTNVLDGTSEIEEKYYYSDRGDLIRTEIDYVPFGTDGIDGTIDRIHYHYYFDRVLDPLIPGVTEGESVVQLTRDAMGRVTERKYDTEFAYFGRADNVFERNGFERTESYTYDGTSDRVTEIRIDVPGGGTVDEIRTYVYNQSGTLTESKIVENAYDADGSRTSAAEDSDDDGNVDKKTFYNAGGNTVTRIEVYTYDSTDPVLKVHDIDGTRVEVYASDERIIETRVYADQASLDNGSAQTIETHEYDARGNRIKTSFDTDASGGGAYERIETYMYGTVQEGVSTWSGRVSTVFDTNADGSPDRVEHYDIHGYIESIEEWVYDTTGDPNTLTIGYASIGYDTEAGTTTARTDQGGVILYEREKVISYTSDVNGTTVTGVEDTEYVFHEDGSRTPLIKRIDMDGDGNVDRVVNYDDQGDEAGSVDYTRTAVQADASAGRPSYETVHAGTDPADIREVWLDDDGDFSFEPSAADGTAWQNVDTIALYNKDEEDLDAAGAEGNSGDATLTLTDDFINALMAGRGSDDHVMIWGDEGDTIEMNFNLLADHVYQDSETHFAYKVTGSDALLLIDFDIYEVDTATAPVGGGEVPADVPGSEELFTVVTALEIRGPDAAPAAEEAVLAMDAYGALFGAAARRQLETAVLGARGASAGQQDQLQKLLFAVQAYEDLPGTATAEFADRTVTVSIDYDTADAAVNEIHTWTRPQANSNDLMLALDLDADNTDDLVVTVPIDEHEHGLVAELDLDATPDGTPDFTAYDGDQDEDPDFEFERIVIDADSTAGATNTYTLTDELAKFALGVTEVSFEGSASTTLSLTAEQLVLMQGDRQGVVIRFDGDSNDAITITSGSVTTTSASDQTGYAAHTATHDGTSAIVLFDTEITVNLPSA